MALCKSIFNEKGEAGVSRRGTADYADDHRWGSLISKKEGLCNRWDYNRCKNIISIKTDQWWEIIGMSGLNKEECLKLKEMWKNTAKGARRVALFGSLPDLDAGDGHRGDAFFTADEAHQLVGGGFDSDLRGFDA